MDVMQKTSSGICLIPIKTKIFAEKKYIFIEGQINSHLLDEFAKQVMYLDNVLSSDDTIDIFINSHGGEVVSGLAIYDIMQSCKNKTRTFCIGACYSMAAILFCAGNARYMLPNAELMFHQPLLSGTGEEMNTSSVKRLSQRMLKLNEKINRILISHSGQSSEQIESLTSGETYVTAEEALKLNLCDGICGFDEMMRGGKEDAV